MDFLAYLFEQGFQYVGVTAVPDVYTSAYQQDNVKKRIWASDLCISTVLAYGKYSSKN